MLRFDKAAYLLLLVKFILSEDCEYWSVRSRCFVISRIHKCSIHSVL